MSDVLTIGYEGLSLSTFLDILKSNGVSLVADVRDLPLSRKRGFSKTPLKEALAKEGIFYRHFRELGAPKPLRLYLQKSGDWQTYQRNYLQLLAQRVGVLEELGLLLREYRVCLLCFEEDPSQCHRSLVGRALVETGWAQGVTDLRKGAVLASSSAR